MIIKKITLNNFKNFEGKHVFEFYKTNIIHGENGSGKSTLAVDSLLFALFGYSDQALEKLPTKWLNSASCLVIVEINDYIITREYPTKITIIKAGEELKFSNSREAQSYLNNVFGDVIQFKKFRMIDSSKGINILEEGQITLKKTLLSFNQDILNNIRERLLKKKRDREIWNKDKAVIYNLYPSEKRLTLIRIKLEETRNNFYKIEKEINDLIKEYNEYINRQGQLENKKETIKWQKDQLLQTTNCYTCKQLLQETTKNTLLSEKNEEIKLLNASLKENLEILTETQEIIEQHKVIKENLRDKINKLIELIRKLEARIKQKDYKYTEKDILIMKKSIEELDNFYSYYITEWVKTLEPIINSIVNKIGFSIKFLYTEDFDIKLYKNNQEYEYKDLSTGQKLILSLAFKLALLLEKNKTGIVIADEGFSSLDESNLKFVLDFFKDMPFQLFAIIHRLNNIPEDIKEIKL